MRYFGAFLWLYGVFYTVRTMGWQYLLAFIPLYFIFTYISGVPAAINVLRTRSMFDKVLLRVAVQLAFALLMCFILFSLRMSEFIGFFILAGVVNAFAIPKASLIKERRELQNH